MSQASLEQFRQQVLQIRSLQQQLRETPDHASFVALMVQLGHAHGHHFTAEDVETAIQTARRAWMERWI